MGKREEEDIFNKLMDLGEEPKETAIEDAVKEDAKEDTTPKAGGVIGKLVNKYGKKIREILEKEDSIEEFLKIKLGENFERIRGALAQYREGEIQLDNFIFSAIFVLRQKFIDQFALEPQEEEKSIPEPEPMPEPTPEITPEPSPVIVKIPAIFLDSISSKSAPEEKTESKALKEEIPSPAELLKNVEDDIANGETVNSEEEQYDMSDILDAFEEIEDLISEKKFDTAISKLEGLKDIAENRNLDTAYYTIDDLLSKINTFKMIESYISAGEKALDNPRKAQELFQKALSFANIIKDINYIEKANNLISQVEQKIALLRKKEEMIDQAKSKLFRKIKSNIVRFGKTNSFSSVEEIRKYCNAKDEDIIINVLTQMIELKEIYAKYFPDSKKIMFNCENNKMLILPDFEK